MFNGVGPTVVIFAALTFISVAVLASVMDGYAPRWGPWRAVRDYAWAVVGFAAFVAFVPLLIASLLHLEPTPTGILLGLLTVALWALFVFWWVAGAWRRTRWGRRGAPTPAAD